MTARLISETTKLAFAIYPQQVATATTVVGLSNAGVDTRGYRRLRAIVPVGTLAGAQTLAIKLQQSSDDGSVDTYADITGATASWAAADDNVMRTIELKSDSFERYIRAHATTTAAAAVDFSVVFELYDPIVPMPINSPSPTATVQS